MQNCKLWRSQILQSLLDDLCTYNTMWLKILETGRTDAILSACGSNGDFCCVPSIMTDWIQVMKLLPECSSPRWIPTKLLLQLIWKTSHYTTRLCLKFVLFFYCTFCWNILRSSLINQRGIKSLFLEHFLHPTITRTKCFHFILPFTPHCFNLTFFLFVTYQVHLGAKNVSWQTCQW